MSLSPPSVSTLACVTRNGGWMKSLGGALLKARLNWSTAS
jgi:hypothetical protein